MEVIICPDAAQVGVVAAARVAQVIRDRGAQVVLGVATGSSPLGLYEELAAKVERGEIDLSQASAFALDEYIGLPEGHPESYRATIDRTVTVPLKMDPAKVSVPDGFSADIATAGERYEEAIKAAGGIDIQILGVGSNGHIGFNEPSSSLASRTRVKALAPSTRVDNARFFDGDINQVPTHCLTQGLGTILDAREAILVAQGEGKADAIAGVVEGPVSAWCPGSVLQMHPRATIVVDEAAASKLVLGEYYRHAFATKMDWQKAAFGI